MRSHTVLAGGPVSYEDFGGSGPSLVLVHGLGGAAINWLAVGPPLAQHARVVALDLVGFGHTPPAGRSARLADNRQCLDRFIDAVVGGPVVLVGNSMGGLIAMMQAVVEPAKVAGLVLVAPAQPHPRGARIDVLVWSAFALYAIPRVAEWSLGRRMARLGAEGHVREVLALLCVDPTRVPADVRTAHVALAAERLERMPWANGAFLEAARSLLPALRRRREFSEMVARIDAPVLLVHGTGDRLVPLAASEALVRSRPDWTLTALPGVGHVPQLEAPAAFVSCVTEWLHGPGGRARAAASGASAARAASSDASTPRSK
jgi:glycerol-3-phosphate dehydrogenase